MKVLVTGGAGYIGSVCVSHLLAQGHQVTVFDRLLYGGEAVLAFRTHPEFRLIAGDVRDLDDLAQAVGGVDAIVHLAAVVGESACAVDDAAAWSINVEGTAAVLAAATAARVDRLLFVSTCSNYGVATLDRLADEDAPLNPLSRYAEAKIAAEQMILAHTGGPTTTVFRFGTICGLSPRMRFDLLISEMARAAVKGRVISLYTPRAWRPFLHIDDAARAVHAWMMAASERVNGAVFNVVGENCQKGSLADLVRRHYPATPIEIVERAPDLRDYRVSGRRIEERLGFRTVRTVEDAFTETAAAVAMGVFRDPDWPGHSAVPLDPGRLPRASHATLGLAAHD